MTDEKKRKARAEAFAETDILAWLAKHNAEAERRWLEAGKRTITRYRF